MKKSEVKLVINEEIKKILKENRAHNPIKKIENILSAKGYKILKSATINSANAGELIFTDYDDNDWSIEIRQYAGRKGFPTGTGRSSLK